MKTTLELLLLAVRVIRSWYLWFTRRIWYVLCIAWSTPMTSKAALNNTLTSCYGSNLVHNNCRDCTTKYQRETRNKCHFLIAGKILSIDVEFAHFGRARESAPTLFPFDKTRGKVKFHSSRHVAYKHINTLSRSVWMWMLIVVKNTFTFDATTDWVVVPITHLLT